MGDEVTITVSREDEPSGCPTRQWVYCPACDREHPPPARAQEDTE